MTISDQPSGNGDAGLPDTTLDRVAITDAEVPRRAIIDVRPLPVLTPRIYAPAMNTPFCQPRTVVLIVEDEALVRIFMADFLDEPGFKVVEAVTADEALRVLAACPEVQAFVTDIEMPGTMTGLQLARRIRDRWPRVGIVVCSGRQRPSPADLPKTAAFLAKPYLRAALTSAIRQVAAPRRVDPGSSRCA